MNKGGEHDWHIDPILLTGQEQSSLTGATDSGKTKLECAEFFTAYGNFEYDIFTYLLSDGSDYKDRERYIAIITILIHLCTNQNNSSNNLNNPVAYRIFTRWHYIKYK